VNKSNIEKLIDRANSGERRSAKSAPPLTPLEREAVMYFFAKFKLLDPGAFDAAMPDEKTEKVTKTEFANMIRGFTKERMDAGFYELKKQIGMNEPAYRFLTVAKVVGFIANNGSSEAHRAGMYKIGPPAIVNPERLLCSPLEAARVKTVRVLNPATGEYSTAVTAPRQSLTVDDRNAAEKTLKKLSSLFGDDE